MALLKKKPKCKKQREKRQKETDFPGTLGKLQKVESICTKKEETDNRKTI